MGRLSSESQRLSYPVNHGVGEHDEPQVPRARLELAGGLGGADAACGVLATDADSNLADDRTLMDGFS